MFHPTLPTWLRHPWRSLGSWYANWANDMDDLAEWMDTRNLDAQLPPVAPKPPLCTDCETEVDPRDVRLLGRCEACMTAWADMEFAKMVRLESEHPAQGVLADLVADLNPEPEPAAAPVAVAAPAPAFREYVLRKAAKARTEKIVKRQITQLILQGTDAGLISDALCVFVNPDLLLAGELVSA